MTPRLFRQLLVAWWVVGVISLSVGVWSDATLPQALRAFVDAQANHAPSRDMAVLAIGLPLVLWNTYELYHFRPRARLVMVALTVVATVFGVLDGPYVDSGLAAAFETASDMIFGAIVVGVFGTPLAQRFREGPSAA